MHRDTQVVHAGYRKPDEIGPFLAGPQFSSTFVAPGDPSQHALTYGRLHNPTWTAWEDALRSLEGGEVVAFASGMAAVAAVFGVALGPGDVLLLPENCYYAIRRVAADWLSRLGVQVRLVARRDNAQVADLLAEARLLWIETPTNPTLDVYDIRALTDAAAARGVLVAVDNTAATSYLQQPLTLGATFVVASDSKAMTGHSDVVLGHVGTADARFAESLRTWRNQQGSIPGPMEVWLAHRSLPTLPLRMGRQCATAQQLAEHLAGRPDIGAVHYPGLATHPGHDSAKRQMRGFGTIVSFDLRTRIRADAFLRALTLVREATSFGGVHSTAERRARWGGDAVSDGFIRFSVGCEAADDILADVDSALNASGP